MKNKKKLIKFPKQIEFEPHERQEEEKYEEMC